VREVLAGSVRGGRRVLGHPPVDADQTPVTGCLAELDEAVAAGLVEPTGTPGAYRFAHVLVRDAIEADLSPSQRVRLHRLAAEATEEELFAQRIEPHLSDLARHWTVAAVLGERARATGWIGRAAHDAMRRLAYEEATRLYRLALDVGAGELGELARCRLLLDHAAALRLSGELTDRLEACQEAAALARRLNRPDLAAEAALLLDGVGMPEFDLRRGGCARRRWRASTPSRRRCVPR
jgi:Predicted ATPase